MEQRKLKATILLFENCNDGACSWSTEMIGDKPTPSMFGNLLAEIIPNGLKVDSIRFSEDGTVESIFFQDNEDSWVFSDGTTEKPTREKE